jgi:hypothetical protein
MSERSPRYVPLTWGLLDAGGAICVIVLWPPPDGGILYWLRAGIFGVFAWMGVWNIKVAVFATDNQIQGAVAKDAQVWAEKEIAAPSIFKLKDMLFSAAGLGLLLLVISLIAVVAT